VLNGSHEYIDEFVMMPRSSLLMQVVIRTLVIDGIGGVFTALDEAVGLVEMEMRVEVHVIGLHAGQKGVHLHLQVPDEVRRGPNKWY